MYSYSTIALVYNGCLAWYNAVLTPRVHSSVKFVGLLLANTTASCGISSFTCTYTTLDSCITYTSAAASNSYVLKLIPMDTGNKQVTQGRCTLHGHQATIGIS